MSQVDCILSVLHHALAEELREVRTLIEQIAEVLVADEQLASNYIEQLQAFDYVIQRADESANLLERIGHGERRPDELRNVRLDVVQQRLDAAFRAKAAA